ncbi:MAG: RagB/SusD family nutrient uptake outer membrane protein, partial [bacterium]
AGPNAGQPALDRQLNQLVFTVNSPIFNATEGNGVRILKWSVDPNQSGGDAGNDFAIFRYSHILLAKAEALNELGNLGDAIALINQVRERCLDPDKPITRVDFNTKEKLRDRILDERGFELLWENFRRQDQIRTGHFLDARTHKPDVSPAYRKLYPIPQIQLDANPNLRQNPGY